MKWFAALFFILCSYTTCTYSEQFSCVITNNNQQTILSAELTDPHLNGLSPTDKQTYASHALALTLCPRAGYPNKGTLVPVQGIRPSNNTKQFQQFSNPACKPTCTLAQPPP